MNLIEGENKEALKSRYLIVFEFVLKNKEVLRGYAKYLKSER